MKCEVALEYVAEYAEDRVEVPLRVVLERHFSECASCRSELASARELIQLFRDLPSVDPPSGFRAAVLARAAAQPSRRRAAWLDGWSLPIGRFHIPITGLAAAALTVGLLFTQTSFHNVSTLGWNPDFSQLGGRSRPEIRFPGASDLLISGSSTLFARVGDPISLDVILQPKADLNNGKVILPRMSDGIVCETPTVPSERGQVAWQGRVGAGKVQKISLHFRASRAAVQRVLLYIEGDKQDYQRLIFIPVMGTTEQRSPASLVKGFWSTSETLEEIAKQFGVIVATDLSHERQQSTDLRLTFPGQAIGQVAAQRGMQWTDSRGVFNVYTPDK